MYCDSKGRSNPPEVFSGFCKGLEASVFVKAAG